MITSKACSKCGVEKPLDAFPFQRAQCKSCRVEATREWRAMNAAHLANRRTWYAANAEKERERNCAWRAANLEKALAQEKVQRARYRAANPEKVHEQQRAWWAAHPGYHRAYDAAHREQQHGQQRAWRAANPEKVRETQAKQHANQAARRQTGMSLQEMPEGLRSLVLTYREINQVRYYENPRKGRAAEQQTRG